MRGPQGLLVVAAVWTLACGGQGAAPSGADDAAPDADVAATDAPDDASIEAGEDLPRDEGPAPDVPRTCEGVLGERQCASTAACAAWTACLGVGGCEEPPCWGLCEDYPGTCLPWTLPEPCDQDEDCGEGAVCAGPVLDPGGGVVLAGLCRKRPSADSCYDDRHCPPGQRCAGEVSCGLDSLCLGPEYPGRCQAPPEAGRCWEGADCPAGQRCVGVEWCAFGDADCPGDVAGTCAAASGCFTDADCAGSPDGGFCVGAFRCREDAQCAFPDRQGFCAPAPGLRQCWQEDHCGGDWVCRAALPCPPGTLCLGTGDAHPGLCGEPPAPAEGIALTLDTNQVQRNVPFQATVVNQGPVPIFLDPCFVALVQFKDDQGQWSESWIPEARHPSCAGGGLVPLWPLPPASGTAATFSVDVPGTYRVQVPYRLGCEQGVERTEARCESDALAATTMAFVVP